MNEAPLRSPAQIRSPWRLTIFLAILLCHGLAAFAANPPTARPPGKRLLLFVGSNTLGEQAVPELAKAYLQEEKKARNAMVQSHGELIYVTATLPDNTAAYIEIRATGSGDAFKSLLAPSTERCDIGLSSRRVTETEAEAIQAKLSSDIFQRGAEPGEGCEHPVGMDGLAIIVHKSNPLSRISFRELKAIYSRQSTDWTQLAEWKTVGGAKDPAPIIPLRRKEPSGTLDFFKERIHPEAAPMKDEKQIAAFTSSGELAGQVAQKPGAIGFVGESYALLPGLKRLQVYDDSEHAMMRPEEAVFPDRMAVRRALYPLSRFVYFYSPLVSINPEVKPFIRYTLSEAGQAVIADRGHLVPIEGTAYHITKAERPSLSEEAESKAGEGSRKKKVILRLHGSNTVGAECAVNLAFDFLIGKAPAGRPPRIEDETTTLETPEGEKAVAHDVMCDLDGDGVWETVEIRPTGSSDAFRDLLQGRCDIGMSSRGITEAEKRDLNKICGDLGAPDAQFALGLDALAVIVAPDNPVAQLTIEQLRGIFTGEITNWSALGGPDRPINLHSRPDRSGTCKSFCDAVLLGRSLAGSTQRHAENATLTEKVNADPGGIGYVPMKNTGGAKVLKIGQEDSPTFCEPTEETVRSGRYPARLCRYVYLYVPAERPRGLSLTARNNWPLAREFAEQSQSWRAQALVAGSGFITEMAMHDEAGQTRRGKDENAEKYVARLRELERKALRQQITLRPSLTNDEICPQLLFEFNQDLPTPEARNLLDRKLGSWLKVYPGVARRGLIAEGWADSDGSDEACQKVSLQRAQKVADYLTDKLGQPIKAVGKGKSYDPPNTSEENKQLNRRVVVKVAPEVLPQVAAREKTMPATKRKAR